MSGLLSLDTKIGYKANGGSSYTDIANLTEVPEIGGSPEKVDVTTLADGAKRYIPGIKDYGDLDFKFLYDNASDGANYRVLKGLETAGEVVDWQVSLPDKTTFQFSGYVSVKLDSVSVGAALYFTATIALNSDVTVTNPTA